MEVTCYDDGESCPGGCDAHTVFRSEHNSVTNKLRNAYRPGTRLNPQACKLGQDCEVCFTSNPDDCVITKYRGSGPPSGRFDVTPNFLHEFCFYQDTLDLRSDVSPGLLSECKRIASGARRLASKINCIETPDHPSCAALMDKAVADWERDRPEFEKCKRMGESEYNKTVPEERQRVYDCAYTKKVNSKGFRQLLPGACRKGTFVSPGGYDCCSADEVVSTCSGDCNGFFK